MNHDFTESFRQADASLVSDALDRCRLGGVVTAIGRLTTKARVAGPVTTIELACVTSDHVEHSHLGAATLDEIEPGTVLVVANAGRVDAASWGGLLGRAAGKRGVAGVIVDGAVRDVDDLEAEGLAVFARMATPVSARGRFREVGRGSRVDVAGVPVEPGDWVVADGSGVVFVKQSQLVRVARVLDELRMTERRISHEIDQGRPVSEAMDLRYELGLSGER